MKTSTTREGSFSRRIILPICAPLGSAQETVSKDQDGAVRIKPLLLGILRHSAQFGDSARLAQNPFDFGCIETGYWLLVHRRLFDLGRPRLRVDPFNPVLFCFRLFFGVPFLIGERVNAAYGEVKLLVKLFGPDIRYLSRLEFDLVVRLFVRSP